MPAASDEHFPRTPIPALMKAFRFPAPSRILAIGLVLGLTACGGGGDTTYVVGGTLAGMQAGDQVTLLNNGADPLVVDENGTFQFGQTVAGNYAVTVGTQPNWQRCTVAHGTGTASAVVLDVQVTCSRTGTVSTLASGLAIPTFATTDAAGNVYVPEYMSGNLRRITPAGVVTTIAGGLAQPVGVAFGPDGALYVAASGDNSIMKVELNGTVTTYAGTGVAGGTNGPRASATFDIPYGVAFDAAGNLYVAEFQGHRIRKIAPGGTVSTFAGSGTEAMADGTGTAASFDEPAGLAIDADGNLYVGDSGNGRVRKVTPAGLVTTLAGNGNPTSVDGAGTAASFSQPFGVAVGPDGYIYVAEPPVGKVRRVSPAGVVNTLAGTGVAGSTDGPVTTATLQQPAGMAVDRNGNVFVTEAAAVRKIAR